MKSIATNYDICKLSNRVHINFIVFGYAKVDNTWRGSVLSPMYSRLYYFSGGSCAIIPKNGKKIIITPGKWYLFPAGFSFDFECENEMEHFYLHLKLCDYDGTDLLRKSSLPLCMDKENENTEFLHQCIKKKTAIDGMYLKQLALEIILKLLTQNNIDIKTDNYSPCVIKAIKYIKENLSIRLSLNEIAENIFVSKSTLTKHFNKELSMSVGKYIYDLIMSEAEYRLFSSSESIQNISERYGFCDQFYFSKRFKEKFGQSPRDYRNNRPW